MIITLVGNAPVQRDVSDAVDASDLVIRFNDPSGLDGPTGTRFDIWVLANSRGGSRFARERRFAFKPWRDRATEIWFPRHLAIHRTLRSLHPGGLLKDTSEIDYGPEILSENGLIQTVRRIDESTYQRAINRLPPPAPDEDPTVIPSSGFVGWFMAQDLFPEAQFQMTGFAFTGWYGHPWSRERAFFADLADQGKLVRF